MMVHVPLAVSVLMPLLWLGLVYFTRKGQLPPKVWTLFWLFAIALNGSNALAFWTGQSDAHTSSAPEHLLHAHEEMAVLFVACGVALLGLSAWKAFWPPRREWPINLVLLTMILVNLYFAVRVGHLGGYAVFGTDH